MAPPESVSVSEDEDELHAYVDGRIDGERRQAVEAHLAANPDDGRRVAAYRTQRDALHALFDTVLREPIPPAMLRLPTPRLGRWLLRVAAVAVLVLLGGVGGWWVRGSGGGEAGVTADLAERAARAHAVYRPEVLHPVEVKAENETHLVKWLSKRLGVPVRAPVLTDAGYALIGGRLLPGAHGPAAHFIYENADGQRMTMYLRAGDAGDRETAFRYTHQQGIGVFYWIDGPLAYAIAGEMEKARLLDIANLIYRQLNP